MSEAGQEGVIGVRTLDDRISTLQTELETLRAKVSKVTGGLYGDRSETVVEAEKTPPYPFEGQLATLCVRCDDILVTLRGIHDEVDRFSH